MGSDIDRPSREAVQALIKKWRAKGATIDMYHATMGIGYKACADDLEALLHAFPQSEERKP